MQVDPAQIDMPQAVHDGAQQPRNRTSGRATATRDWKRARTQDILSDSDEEGDEGSDVPYSDPYEDELSEGESLQGKQFPLAPTRTATHSGAPEAATSHDPKEVLLFDPDNLRHPRSAEWEPSEHIARYLALRVPES
ncbi:Hypothetical predicted protein [Pelobates cultripes]|uniref:Uncharacterized protein n=1 Tax=Pelobates cultripes TaxID=61616 RepID=A0AAD1SWR6_PELCU|nr:Hypothetical predicted protein [Pelobates cultripes]